MVIEKGGFFKNPQLKSENRKNVRSKDNNFAGTYIFSKILHLYRVKMIINGNDLESFEFDGRKKFC